MLVVLNFHPVRTPLTPRTVYMAHVYTGLDDEGGSSRVARLRVLFQPPRPAPAGQTPREYHGVHLQLQRSALVARPGERLAAMMKLE